MKKLTTFILSFVFAVAAYAQTVTGFTPGTGIGESHTTVQVSTKDPYGKTGAGSLVTTVWVPSSGEGPFPVIILNHGRNPKARALQTRFRYSTAARTLTEAGYVVIIPTRLGYGANAAFDPEEIQCNNGYVKEAFNAGADQVEQVIKWAKTLPYVKKDSIYLLGYSVGGGITSMAASRNIDGVLAAVNFSGGHGGQNTKTGSSCASGKVGQAFEVIGKTKSKVPQLWIYADNDEYFGKDAEQWFKKFEQAGGKGSFTTIKIDPQFDGYSGHLLFELGVKKWKSDVIGFFQSNKPQ